MLKVEMQNQVIIIAAIIGIFLFVLNFLFFLSSLLTLLAIAFVLTGPAVTEYVKYHNNKEIEDRFPDFLNDISRGIKSGMTLIQAIKSTKNVNYGAFSISVKKIINQIDWGVPFDEVLTNFSKKSTLLIKRTVSTIIETHKEGGDISDVLQNVSRSALEINNLRKERFSGIYSQVLTGYIVFFVFVGVLVSLQNFLVPNITSISTSEFSFVNFQAMKQIYSDVFQWLIIIQGFFSGLVIGKLSEGKMIAGLKHSLLMILVGFAIFVLI